MGRAGRAPLRITALRLDETRGGTWRHDWSGEGELTIEPGATHTLNVTFEAVDKGSCTAKLCIEHGDGQQATVDLKAHVKEAVVRDPARLRVGPLSSGKIKFPSKTRPKDISLRNDGEDDLEITALQVEGDFELEAPALPVTIDGVVKLEIKCGSSATTGTLVIEWNGQRKEVEIIT